MSHQLKREDVEFYEWATSLASAVGCNISKQLFIDGIGLSCKYKVTSMGKTQYVGNNLTDAIEAYNSI